MDQRPLGPQDRGTRGRMRRVTQTKHLRTSWSHGWFLYCSTVLCSLEFKTGFERALALRDYIGHHWSIFWIELKQAQRNSMLKQKRGPTAPHFWFARPKTNQPLAISPDRRFLMRSLLLQANREIAQVHLSLIVMTDGNDSTARGCRLLKYIEVPLQPLPWSPCQLAVSY